MTVQLGWKVDVNACISCRACEIACKVEYDIKAGQGRRRRVIEKTITEASADTGKNMVRTFFLSLACNQCENPACIAACPIGDGTEADKANSALWKDVSGTSSGGVTGVVRVNADKCIGCRRCEWACPYGAPQFNPESGKIHKCEMCWERISNTALHPSRRVGACVATCLGQAIKQDWIDLATASVAHTRKDTDGYTEGALPTDTPTGNGLLDCDENYSATGADGGSQTYPTTTPSGLFVKAGAAGKGSAYLADAAMTGPALRIRNRIYVKRDGSGVE